MLSFLSQRAAYRSLLGTGAAASAALCAATIPSKAEGAQEGGFFPIPNTAEFIKTQKSFKPEPHYEEQEVESSIRIAVKQWLQDAAQTDDVPTDGFPVALATASTDGQPTVRMVLLKEIDSEGFIIYTNNISQKGKDMLSNPRASLLLYCPSLGRQLRVEGRVDQVSPEKSDAYFASRSRGSQLAAASSMQSRPLSSRNELMERLQGIEAANPGQVSRPASWGGWRLRPQRIELWSDGSHRLHTRHSYTLQASGKWHHTMQQP